MRGALGLCRRAGALALGFDAARDAAQRGEAVLVLLAADNSPKTSENAVYFCQGRCPVHTLALTQDDLAQLLGKKAGVIAVTDKNLADLCLKNSGTN